MFRLKKNKNILSTLRDREMNVIPSPYKYSLNIMSQLIKSDQTIYESSWYKQSSKPIMYDNGILYFDNYRNAYTIYGSKGQPSATKLSDPSNSKKVKDVISYSSPVFKMECTCKLHPCTCLSNFIIYITDDNWLFQRNPYSGDTYNQVYVKRSDRNFKFKYCDWNVYAEQFILTTKLDPDENEMFPGSDAVVNLAVFGVFPLEFKALFEIKRSVFGKACKHANVADRLLIIGMGYHRVHIYSFDELLAKNTITPYNLGDCYDSGYVGMHPTGLPLNCDLRFVPPLLFSVESSGQTVEFGGFPFHCMYACPSYHLRFVLKQLPIERFSRKCYVESNVWNDEPNIIYFHPDNSNRIISREAQAVRCFQIVNSPGQLKIKEVFSMGFEAVRSYNPPEFSSFGRRITRMENLDLLIEKYIMAIDYDNETDLIGILGTCYGDPLSNGFIKLFDNLTGKEVKTVSLNRCLCDINYYQLYVDLDVLIVIEKNERNQYSAFLYKLTNCYDKE
ncbi:DDB1-and CUL4-associated factor 17 [Trichonephila inaurata madagascariensis]|uniref:DDB1-and CUL4-associated factor 17 n=1 Tax=Trichonephila inaurata madagascariensis TaxID=2747483 RepID=A0A8X6YAE4_9ARAC|nr:DDB1-and CUL4-associated factor 17 [Trichonephila inaurata madagascariensis]